ncbi:MAG: carbohydrate-binding family 9-like protein [Fimbriimonadaceae bacterium]|nr:carbohydrate-binding family 9-like protein [Fimbriimonadaceae bacterium]
MRELWRLLPVLLAALGAVAETPVADFESDADQPFQASGAQLQRVEQYATSGKSALRVRFAGSPADSWPGLLLRPASPAEWAEQQVLLADIYLAGTTPETLCWRIDETGGRNVFGSGRLKPGWNRAFALNLLAYRNELDLRSLGRLLLYLRMPRQDVELFIDNVRWGTFAARYRRLLHLDEGPPLPPTAAETERGAQLFEASTLGHVFPTTWPQRRLGQLGLVATPGELEPVAFGLHALREQAVGLSVSELVGPAGARLPPTIWDLSRVVCLPKRVHYASEEYISDLPSYYASLQGPVTVPAGRSQGFHLTAAVPPGTPAGRYQGSLGVRCGNAVSSVPLHLLVLPLTLPEPRGLLYGEYYRLFGRDRTAADLRADLADMRAHQMTSVGLCFGVDPSCYRHEPTGWSFQWPGNTPFEWFMEAARELGFREPLILLSDSGQAAAGTVAAYGTPEYDRAYVQFHVKLAAELRAKGWPALLVQPVDEPGWQSQADRDRNVALLKLLHAAGVATEQDGPGDAYFHDQAGPLADWWNYNGALGPTATVEAARRAGKRLLIYNNDVESYQPETDRWAYGYFNWRHGLHGGFNWEYRGGSGDLYDNLDAEHGDWVHRYPPQDQHPGGPSLGWEASREGVEDRRYLLLLEELLAAARPVSRARGAVQAAEQWLASLRTRLSSRGEVRGRAAWSAVWSPEQARAKGYVVPADVTKVLVGPLKQPNGLALEEYDTLRWLAARHAWDLAAALGRTPPPPRPSWQPGQVTARLSETRQEPLLGAASIPRPALRVPFLKQLPQIDGELDGDPGWAGAAMVTLTRSDGGSLPQMPTQVRFALREQQLYVAFVCQEDRVSQLTASIREPDGPVWNDDCVEVFLDPGAGGKQYYQVAVNTLGTIARRGPDGKVWPAPVRAAARVEPALKRWVAELAIPVANLRLEPRFGLNFGRERRPLEVLELSSWAVTGGPFGRPERFGLAVTQGDLPLDGLVEPQVSLSLSPSWLPLEVSSAVLRADLQLPLGAAGELRLTATGPRRCEARLPVKSSTRLTSRLALGDLPAGEYRLTARLELPQRTSVTATVDFSRVVGPFTP